MKGCRGDPAEPATKVWVAVCANRTADDVRAHRIEELRRLAEDLLRQTEALLERARALAAAIEASGSGRDGAGGK